MSNTHSFINTTRCTCWDVDAFNAAGISVEDTPKDYDNGMFVARGALQLTNATAKGGYEFAVTLPSANATNLWVVDTPEAALPIEMQIYDDPRYFYNVAGRPMSIRYLQAEVDFIEVPASAFSSGNAPADHATYTFASVGTDGRLAIAQNAPDAGTYFALAGTHTIDIGNEIVTTYILQCKRN